MLLKFRNFLDHSYSRNIAFTFLMAVLCIILGSTSTALFLISVIVVIFFNTKISINELWLESFKLVKQLPILSIFPLFFFFTVFTSFRGNNWLGDAIFVAGSYWQFIVMIPASIGLYRLSKDVNFSGVFSYGCRFGLLFVVPLSLAQIYFLNIQPEGFLSNPLIFATLCIAAAGFAILEWREDTQKNKTLGWIAFAAGILAALLTFSRGMVLPISVVILISIFYSFKIKSKHKLSMKTVAVLAAFIIAIFVASIYSNNGWRILNKKILQPIEMYNLGQPIDQSISQRLDMQITGFHAFKEQPIWGYGIQNTVEEANLVSQEVLGRKTEYTYTHLHNDYLTHAVGGGLVLMVLFILVILSPVLLSWRFRNNEKEAVLFYFSVILSGVYSTAAMSNVVFHNDQLTTMFCIATIFVMIRRLQLINGQKDARIPDFPTIANGINPIGRLPSKG